MLTLRPYAPDDLDLLRALDRPEMKAHLGGPEGEEATLARHDRYLQDVPGTHVERHSGTSTSLSDQRAMLLSAPAAGRVQTPG